MSEAIVVVRIDEDGNTDYYVAGESVRLFIVDERSKSDRVYEWLNRDPMFEVKELLGDSPVGNNKDARHPAIAHKVRRYIAGKPHLEVVKEAPVLSADQLPQTENVGSPLLERDGLWHYVDFSGCEHGPFPLKETAAAAYKQYLWEVHGIVRDTE